MAEEAKIRRTDSADKTTADSLTGAGAGAILLWFFGMIDAEKFFVPPAETAMIMGAGMLPIIKALNQRWIRKIEQQSVGGVNGQAPKCSETGDGAGAAGSPA